MSKEAKGPISLVQILLTCVPFKIVNNGYANILDFFNIIQDCSKVGKKAGNTHISQDGGKYW